MNAEQFVDAMQVCITSMEEAIQLVDSINNLQNVIDRFNITLRSDVERQSDPLLDLVTRFDCSKTRIGHIEFFHAAEKKPKGWFVATTELDTIFLASEHAKVSVEEFDGFDDSPVYCAASSEQFLDALVPAARYFYRCFYDISFYEDDAQREKIIEECIRLAGGPEYQSFYVMLLR